MQEETALLHFAETIRIPAHAPGIAVDAVARMRLETAGIDETSMTWEADVNVSGQLGAVGITSNSLDGQQVYR